MCELDWDSPLRIGVIRKWRGSGPEGSGGEKGGGRGVVAIYLQGGSLPMGDSHTTAGGIMGLMQPNGPPQHWLHKVERPSLRHPWSPSSLPPPFFFLLCLFSCIFRKWAAQFAIQTTNRQTTYCNGGGNGDGAGIESGNACMEGKGCYVEGEEAGS